jgi:hypothetical protein
LESSTVIAEIETSQKRQVSIVPSVAAFTNLMEIRVDRIDNYGLKGWITPSISGARHERPPECCCWPLAMSIGYPIKRITRFRCFSDVR